jgi:serine protease Do
VLRAMMSQVIIRHVSGAKANRIEQFKLDGLDELTIGRAAAASINFDGPLHDSVSRRHACIRITKGERLGFTIMDLGSCNGVWVNGEPITGERELSLDDMVALGAGGPSFRFDVQPRPAYLADGVGVDPIPTLDATAATASARVRGARGIPDPPRVRRHKPAGRTRAYLLSAVLVGAGTGAGALLYRRGPLVPGPAPQQTAPVNPPAVSPPAAAGMSPEEIARKLARSNVAIAVQWRLYDKFTGKPIFQRILTRRGQKIPCFVELANHQIVPWLSTDDEEHTNIPVGGETAGRGVVISQQGAILTNKHIAAAWMTPYDLRKEGAHLGALFPIQAEATRDPSSTLFELDAESADATRLAPWVPGDGGVLFRSRYPIQVGESQNNLEGRNEIAGVGLTPGQVGTAARLVRVSADADMAELKIDTDRPLVAAELAQDDMKIGDKVTILGYPAAASGAVAAAQGDVYQLTMAGDSGSSSGPVFDANGRVAALVTTGGAGATLYAYPIKFARVLLQLQ